MRGRVQHLNPEELHKNPAYSQAVVTSGNIKTVYVGGKNAVNTSGEVIRKGDTAAQAEQIFKNLKTALATGEARLEHVIKWNIYVVKVSRPSLPLKCFSACGATDPTHP